MATTTHTTQPVAAGGHSPARVAGRQYLQLQVNAVDELTGAVGRTALSRRYVAQDLIRGRTSSAERIGEAIADAVQHGADPVQVLAVGERIHGWFRALVRMRIPVPSLMDAWETESREQLEADLAQRRAINSRDPGAIAHAIRETDEHLAAAQQLRDALAERHAALLGRVA